MRLPFCTCLALAAAAALPAAVNLGDSHRKVLKELGRPSGSIEAGNTLSLHYPGKVIKLEGGKVVAIETPPARSAPAAEPAAGRTAAPARPKATAAASRGAAAPGVQPGRWTTDYNAALEGAKQRNLHVILFFTGQDWSGESMRLQHEIFSTPTFASYAREHLMLVELEFSKKRRLPPALHAQNEQLKRHYGIQRFPVIVVLDSAGRQLGMLGYVEGGPEAFLTALKEL